MGRVVGSHVLHLCDPSIGKDKVDSPAESSLGCSEESADGDPGRGVEGHKHCHGFVVTFIELLDYLFTSDGVHVGYCDACTLENKVLRDALADAAGAACTGCKRSAGAFKVHPKPETYL